MRHIPSPHSLPHHLRAVMPGRARVTPPRLAASRCRAPCRVSYSKRRAGPTCFAAARAARPALHPRERRLSLERCGQPRHIVRAARQRGARPTAHVSREPRARHRPMNGSFVRAVDASVESTCQQATANAPRGRRLSSESEPRSSRARRAQTTGEPRHGFCKAKGKGQLQRQSASTRTRSRASQPQAAARRQPRRPCTAPGGLGE